MPSVHDEMATQSLPSFAQTFGGGPSAINRLDANNSLPPIQHRASPFERNRKSPAHRSPQPPTVDSKQNNRKRLHAESSGGGKVESAGSDGRRSPRTVRIKEEAEYDALPPTSQSRTSTSSQPQQESTSITPSSASPNPSKKRRVTISGMSHPINTDVRRPSVDSGTSPVIMGFKIMRDDPNALEQVRSMITVKQKQKALIEQRRGSTAGIVTPIAPPDVNVVNPRPGSEECSGPSPKPPGRAGGRSPNIVAAAGGTRRSIVSSSSAVPASREAAQSNPRQPSPPTRIVPSQQQSPQHPAIPIVPSQQQQQPSQHPPLPSETQPPIQTHLHPSSSAATVPPPILTNALPPPPISFARRRAGRQLGGGKAKPADIVISPRDTQTDTQLQPVIQSAPPIPRAGQGQSTGGRFPMALPSLPNVMASGQINKRLTSGQVPPTPTRLAMRHSVASTHLSQSSGRSPPASVPISTTLVPPTPASLQHPGYSGEKSAFLAPFEMFYDALNDSKHLKNWLGDQLQKSNALMASLSRQQEHLEETVNALVDKKVSAMREEVYGLRVRVDELEQQLRHARGAGYSPNMAGAKLKGKANGFVAPPGVVPETYTFPPIDPYDRRTESVRRISSPIMDKDSEPRSRPGSEAASPVPFDVGRRLSVSAMRLEAPRAHPPSESTSSTRPSYGVHSVQREGPSHAYPPPLPTNSWSPRSSKATLPTSSTRSSLSHTLASSDRSGLTKQSSGQGPRFGGGEKHSYRDKEKERMGDTSNDPEGEGRSERERGGSDSHPTSSQRRNSIAAPGPSSQRSGCQSPMDES